MKPKPTKPTAAKPELPRLPKAFIRLLDGPTGDCHFACIPCLSRKEAAAVVKLHKEDALYRLHMAAAEWVVSMGGKLLVTGAIQVIEWPRDAAFNFTLGIKCTGRKPTALGLNQK